MNDDRTDYKSGVVVVPASLAIAEQRKISGKEFIVAICLGIELGVRIALSINPKPAHALSPVIGCFAAAAGAGKILSLNSEQMLDALGIAYCQICPSGIGIFSPSLTKRLTPGLASKSGVFSALLAEKGFKGNRNIFQGPHGYFREYQGEEGDLEQLTSGLGQRYEMVEIGPKGYPCCRGMHASIDATMELVSEHDIKPDDVEVIIVYESERNPIITSGGADPDLWEKNRRPQGDVDAQFSLPWGVATAIVKRDVFIGDFTGDGLKNPQIQQIAERVKVEIDPELSQVDTMSTPSIVEIRTRGGEVFSKRVNFAKGNPNNPITMARTIENFRRCAAFAALPFSEAQWEKALQMMINLEEMDDIKELPQVLVG
jgi:2-methylcitrate dehydratase PrpD